MKFTVATNWQNDLVGQVKKDGVIELFGKLGSDFIGGLRASLTLPHPSRSAVRRHIGEIHDYGLKFNYLLNSVCLNNLEYTISGQREIRKLLDWLAEIKADAVTVSIPYLAQLIKRHYPRFRLYTSLAAGINNPQKARYWEDLGAEVLTLCSLEVTRDFTVLKAIRKSVRCELQLIANNGCYSNCPVAYYHGLAQSHASQSFNRGRGCEFYYCGLTCRLLRLNNPVNFLRADWIRPEDVKYYEQAGIDRIKITERVASTAEIARIARAYAERRYDGNLADLIPALARKPAMAKSKWRIFLAGLRYLSNPFAVNTFRLFKFLRALSAVDIHIDNRALDGFLEHFVNGHCDGRYCRECGYCDKIALKAVKIDESCRLKTIARYKGLLDELVSGRLFRYF